jgi:hypothetical protein
MKKNNKNKFKKKKNKIQILRRLILRFYTRESLTLRKSKS